MSQASDAMKLASESGMTLKEAWAQVKGEGGGSTTSSKPSADERGQHTLASLKAKAESW